MRLKIVRTNDIGQRNFPSCKLAASTEGDIWLDRAADAVEESQKQCKWKFSASEQWSFEADIFPHQVSVTGVILSCTVISGSYTIE